MDRLKNKVAIVTGGAAGLGAATCRLFAKEGAAVVIADIDDVKGKLLEQALCGDGQRAVFLHLDVTVEKNWQSVFEKAVELYGKVNILVNNAGVLLLKDIESTTLADWEMVMKVNATGTFLGTKYAITFMKKTGEPCSIVNRSSVNGQIGEPGIFAYCASKGADTLLTKAAALHCGKKGYSIRVNSVHPGFVRTDMTDQEAAQNGQSPEAYCAQFVAKHPIGYIGRPMDVAYADLYLASDESLFTTGSELNVDGGATAF